MGAKKMKKEDVKVVVNGVEMQDIVGIEFTMSPEDIVAKMKVQTITSTLELEGNMKVSTITYTNAENK
jgi:two-component SAPR family response regulator